MVVHRSEVSRFIRRYPSLIILTILIVAAVLRYPWLFTTIERDEGLFAYTAWKVVRGDRLYSDMGIINPPLIYLTYAVMTLLFGNSFYAIRLVNAALFLLSVGLVYKMTERLFNKKMAVCSSLIYALLMNLPVFEGPLAMTETFIVYFSALSIFFLTLYNKKNNLAWFPALFFMYIATLYKYPAITGVAFVNLYLLLRRRNWAFFIRLLIANIALVVATLLSYFVVMGQANPLFLAHTVFSLTLQSYILNSHNSIPWALVLFMVVEAAPFILLFLIGSITHKREVFHLSEYGLVYGWFIFSLALAAIPPFFPHYFLQVVPQVAIICAWGVAAILSLKQRALRYSMVLLGVLLIVFSFIIVLHQYPNLHIDYRGSKWAYNDLNSFEDQMKLAKFVQDNSIEGDIVGIIGFTGDIHFLAGRFMPDTLTDGFGCGSFNAYPSLIHDGTLTINISEKSYRKLIAENRVSQIPVVTLDKRSMESYAFGTRPENVTVFIVYPHYLERCRNHVEDAFVGAFTNWMAMNISGVTVYTRT